MKAYLLLPVALAAFAVSSSARNFTVTRLTTNGNAKAPVISESGLVAWQHFSPEAYGSIATPSDILVWKDGVARNITKDDPVLAGTAHHPAVSGGSVAFLASAPKTPGGHPLEWAVPQKTQKMIEMEQEYPSLFEPPTSALESQLAPDADSADSPAAPESAPFANAPEHNVRQSQNWRSSGRADDVFFGTGDFSTIERVTPGTRAFLSPVVCEAGVASLVARGWPYGYEMAVWKPGQPNLSQITTNYFYVLNPCAHGHELVFQAWDGFDYEIFLYDFDSGELKQITNNTFDDTLPVVCNGQIAWVARPTVNTEIFLYRDGNILKISSDSTDNNFPSIWNGRVVWQGLDEDGDLEIFYFDGHRTIKLTSNAWDDIAPKIADGIIVWSSYINNWDAEAMALDLGDNLTFQLTDNDAEDISIQTAGEKIVWQTVRPEGTIIQFAEPSEPRAHPVD